MKLKTKFQDEDFELGEVTDAHIVATPDGRITVQAIAEAGGRHTFYYDSLQAMCEDWKDAPEEPKEYWYIDCYGIVLRSLYNGNEWDERRRLIGNYFETREEAEKAVERLCAWQRLKDKGFRFRDWYGSGDATNTIRIYAEFPDIELGPIAGSDLGSCFSKGEE